MKLVKLVVAFGIAFFLAGFIGSSLSTFYKSPSVSYTSCYSLRNLASGTGVLSGVADTTEYDKCLKDQQAGLENYQIIYFAILAILGLGVMILGFFLLEKESVAAGLIGGGIMTILFGGFFAAITGLLTGLGSISGSSGGTSILQYLNLLFLFVALGVLILFAIIKVEREPIPTSSIVSQ